MTTLTVEPGGALRGHVRVPGDKSISHRSIIIGALAEGVSEVEGFLEGKDCLATMEAFKAMGVTIEGPDAGRLRIHGVGMHGLRAPAGPLDMGNSGTAMRLMAGILAAQGFYTELTGDASLCRRPMGRISGPLNRMGAGIEPQAGGTPPLRIQGGRALSAIDYAMPVASAQVKSAVLLAGMYAHGRTCVTEPAPTRDHTERMLATFGYPVERHEGRACLDGGGRLTATGCAGPRGHLLGGLLPGRRGHRRRTPRSPCRSVGINPTRIGGSSPFCV